MKSSLLLSLLLVMTLAPLGRAETADPDEIAIYKILFRGTDTVVLEKSEPSAKVSVVEKPDPKEQADFIGFLKKQFPSAEDATIAAYVQHPPAAALLTHDTGLGVKLIFIDAKTLGQIFKPQKDIDALNAEWDEFKKRYPVGGYTSVSRVSFNPAKTQALVFIETFFGSTGMDGYTVYLEKHNEKWIEVGREEDVAS